jgi:hypothetical protein
MLKLKITSAMKNPNPLVRSLAAMLRKKIKK